MNDNEPVLKPMAAAVFLVFFNGYMVAPLIPSLSREFSLSIQTVGLVVPAYLLSYGFSTLLYGPLSDRIGRKQVLIALLIANLFVTAAGAFATSFAFLITIRIASGLCAGGILPIALAWAGDAYPYQKLGRPMGWLFGAVAGGSAFGSTCGAWLNPVIGWRNEYVVLALANAAVLYAVWQKREVLERAVKVKRRLAEILGGYAALLKTKKARGTFTLVFFNGVFHSGVFSWLGFYLYQRYQLSDAGIGTALLGYGLPGMLLGPTIGKAADRFGRRLLIPLGFAIAAICAYALIASGPLWIVAIVITILSIGFDMTHPLMSGIVASLDPDRRGQAMGLNAFAIFTGYGLGALAFQLLLNDGFTLAFAVFATAQLFFGFLGLGVFRSERTQMRISPIEIRGS